MDWVVHINNGSMEAKPIVLRLLPGEETIFNLKVVNHGEPSNISLEASNPVFKAVRLRKPDHYVVMEETIPIMARMPSNKSRLEGEILLTSSAGESRVPITLLRDSEDPGDDLEDPRLQVDEDLPDEQYGNRSDAVDEDEDEDLDDAEALEAKDREGREDDGSDDDPEGNSDEEDDYGRIVPKRDPDSDDEEREPRRIVFSKDRDLQRYRAATRSRDPDRNANVNPSDYQENPAGSFEEAETAPEAEGGGRKGRRDGLRDASWRSDEPPIERKMDILEEGQIEELKASQPSSSSSYQDDYQTIRQDQARDAGGYSPPHQYPSSDENPSEMNEAEEDYLENEGSGGLFGNFGELGALQIIPIIIFLALVVVLVLTFITESIPEFPGALGASILIVTLIIYGAATLLKA